MSRPDFAKVYKCLNIQVHTKRDFFTYVRESQNSFGLNGPLEVSSLTSFSEDFS